MAPLFALAELCVAAGILYFTLKSFWTQDVSKGWWLVLAIAAAVGGLAGGWVGFNSSYQPSSRVIVYSFPVPGGFHVLEKYDNGTEQWVDFITPAPMLVAIANACFLFSTSLALVWLAHFIVCRLHRNRELVAMK